MPTDMTMPANARSQIATPNESPKKREYVVARHVAVFKEHALDDGSYLGPEGLQQIAQNNNSRIQSTGDATPLIIGHTDDGTPEDEQPQIVGYATNFHVGPLFETGQMALFADFHVDKAYLKPSDKYPHGLVNSFPRRSVEFWPGRMEIDPISLLGATTPQQDLGLLQFSRRNEVVIRYSRIGRRRTERGERFTVNITPPARRYARPAAAATAACECGDRSCPRCKGACRRPSTKRLYRRDMRDRSGVRFCDGCAGDAATSGLFSPRPTDKPIQHNRRHSMAGNSHPIYPGSYGYGFTPNGYGRVAAPAPTVAPTVGTPSYQPNRYAANGQAQQYAANGRNGSPRRYDAMGGGLDTPVDTGDGNASMVQAVINSAPMQEIIQGQQQTQQTLQELVQMVQQMAGGGMGGQGGPPMGGGDQGDMGGGQDIGGEDGGMPPADDQQGEPQPGDGGGHSDEARWQHEGSMGPGTAEAEEGPPTQYGMDGDHDEDDEEGCEQYAMDGMHDQYSMHGEPHAMHGEHYGMDILPEHYAMGEHMPPEHMLHESRHETGISNGGQFMPAGHHEAPMHYGAYASSTNGYIPTETPMHGATHYRRPAAPRPAAPQQPARYSRTPSQYELYLRSLGGYRNPQTGQPAPVPQAIRQIARGEQAMHYAREQQARGAMERRIIELEKDKVRYSRAQHLNALRTQHGIVLDIAEEVADTDHMDDAGFKKHCDKIVKRYSRDEGVAMSAVSPVRVAAGDSAPPATGTQQADEPFEMRLDNDGVRRYARDLSNEMMALRPKNPDISGEELERKARENLKVRYSRSR